MCVCMSVCVSKAMQSWDELDTLTNIIAILIAITLVFHLPKYCQYNLVLQQCDSWL